jgi:predicted DNA-binding transcriptional regulator AlpA
MRLEPDLLYMRHIVARTGRSRSTIQRMVRAGEFPSPSDFVRTSRAWASEDVTEWFKGKRSGWPQRDVTPEAHKEAAARGRAARTA